MYYSGNENNLYKTIQSLPDAVAIMRGNRKNNRLDGTVKFYQAINGVFVIADIRGLPYSLKKCGNNIYGFHIHSGTECTGNSDDLFANSGTHYNPLNCPHPYHAGDMPPLFGVSGHAILAFLTDRFTLNEVIGKAVIIHDKPDDFTTQPSGNSGNKIACGIISRVSR